VASVLFGLAEIESEYRRERQAAGIAVAKERGAYRGRQWGTTKAAPRRAQELRGRGLAVQEIATALGVRGQPACQQRTGRSLRRFSVPMLLTGPFLENLTA
jgi:DNA invertase Pin-like site-specific DNA recombinase